MGHPELCYLAPPLKLRRHADGELVSSVRDLFVVYVWVGKDPETSPSLKLRQAMKFGMTPWIEQSRNQSGAAIL
jgi:hypothetical protein